MSAKSDLQALVADKKSHLLGVVAEDLDAIKAAVDALPDTSELEAQVAALQAELVQKNQLLEQANQKAKELDALLPDQPA